VRALAVRSAISYSDTEPYELAALFEPVNESAAWFSKLPNPKVREITNLQPRLREEGKTLSIRELL